MTQDQYGQAREAGYVGPDDQTDENKPMTRFQRVASALLGEKTDQDEADHGEPTAQAQPTSSPVTTKSEATTGSDATAPAPEAAARGGDRSGTAGSGVRSPDYWDEPETAADGTEASAVTRPDGPASRAAAAQDSVAGQAGADTIGHPATEPDTFGTTRPDSTAAPYAEGQPGAATIADAPAGGTAAGDAPATAVPARAGTSESAGRHAVAAADAGADSGLRPGQATGSLGDFSDLTYGNLVPDAAIYAEQWQQIQFKFVDDPQASVTEAADIVAQVTAKMEAAIQERQRAVEERQRAIADQQRSLRGRWGEGTNADTEAMRETLRLYKTFLDQLIGPRAS